MYGEWVIPEYSHVRVLGDGSAGEVVPAVQHEFDVPVAIKYLTPRPYDDHEFTDRFREEARLLAEIRDPHLCVSTNTWSHVTAPRSSWNRSMA